MCSAHLTVEYLFLALQLSDFIGFLSRRFPLGLSPVLFEFELKSYTISIVWMCTFQPRQRLDIDE